MKNTAIKDLPRSDSDRIENVRREIFERAIELFDSYGFRGTSMNRIAEACGVSKPALYHYFDSKSHLLDTLYQDIMSDFFSSMETLARKESAPPTEKLGRLVELQVLHNIHNSRFLKIFWRERHEFDEGARRSLAQREREFEEWVRSIIIAGQASGEFAQGSPQVLMLSVLGTLSTVHRWYQYANASPEEVARSIRQMVLTGVAETKR
ncbi:TetR/AcrR family transcriptional regulator [Nitratireductor kimnyeongensis]|uniref:TetR/AcrR family transcriptional regulator n=1 Tax=Nitratireductor kimnyeongensis TaxID=430679 RepID=A0ABW0T5X1_9HYPH|nr:TetR/AcrR family transcriptional regulator [Nitratireductor kimnyeongensis]QZZ34622.1 TetR/AcrR family transcriptional regulator [Nitratireductor kimnyeongensis]